MSTSDDVVKRERGSSTRRSLTLECCTNRNPVSGVNDLMMSWLTLGERSFHAFAIQLAMHSTVYDRMNRGTSPPCKVVAVLFFIVFDINLIQPSK